LAGPFAADFPLGPDTREHLPPAIDSVSATSGAPRFYWFHPEAAGHTLGWTLRAEAVANLDQGSVIHEETTRVPPGESHRQGLYALTAERFSRGGTRRSGGGAVEWLPGLYSLSASVDGTRFARLLFEVR